MEQTESQKSADVGMRHIERARQTNSFETVGIGEMRISADRKDVLATYSLGSCIGVVMHDPVAGAAGMIHCMLPLSKMSPEKAKMNPCMFVDTGIIKLLEGLFELGATRGNLSAVVAGAAHMLDTNRTFRIGQRNFAVLRKVLWKNDILVTAKDLGGTVSRSLFFHVGSGQAALKKGGTVTPL
ncbi:MAG: chemotaxis protein CheD [Planctomycetota bacterium]